MSKLSSLLVRGKNESAKYSRAVETVVDKIEEKFQAVLKTPEGKVLAEKFDEIIGDSNSYLALRVEEIFAHAKNLDKDLSTDGAPTDRKPITNNVKFGGKDIKTIGGSTTEITTALGEKTNKTGEKLAAAKAALKELFKDSKDAADKNGDGGDFYTKIDALKDLKSTAKFLENFPAIKARSDQITQCKTALSALNNLGIKDSITEVFVLYSRDPDEAKSLLRASAANSDSYENNLSDFAQLQLRALSYPSLTEIGNFRIPELEGVTLKITLEADPAGTAIPAKHVMTFTSLENAKAFWEKLSWKCIKDGKEVFSGTIPPKPTGNELTLDLGSSDENPIETLGERIRYSHEAYKENKAFVDSRLDRTTKKLAAAALNLTAGVPLVPMVCFGLGKTFQWTHEKTGFGSTLARTFLHTAKLGLENSHLFSLKDPDNKTTWPIGTALKDSEKSLKAIDRRESKIVESKNKFKIPNFIRGASAILTGFVGAIFNLTSIPLNWLGDSCINVAAKDLKNSAKEGVVLTKMVAYPLAAVATVLGAGFRIPGMLCRSAGSILSADANCLADARSGKTDLLSGIGRVVRQVDNFTQRQGRSQAAPDDKIAEKINFTKTQLTDPDLEEVRTRALDIFKNIQSPNFVSSGIPKDEREYCEVAELTLNDHAYKLLFSPVDGAISIVSSQKDLNFNEKVNSWNTDMSAKTDRDKFKELIKKLDVKISADEKSVGNNEVTRARDNGGLSYEKFAEKKRTFESDKNKSKNGEISFTHAGDRYEYRADAFSTDKNVVLHRKKGKDMIPVGGLDEFKIISEVFANNEFEFSNPFAKPSASPKATIAQALAEAKTKNYFSQ